MPKTAKMRHCAWCGGEIGIYADWYPEDTCGKPECDREMRAVRREEREEAHRKLDDELDW